jgi:hypothetical protein
MESRHIAHRSPRLQRPAVEHTGSALGAELPTIRAFIARACGSRPRQWRACLPLLGHTACLPSRARSCVSRGHHAFALLEMQGRRSRARPRPRSPTSAMRALRHWCRRFRQDVRPSSELSFRDAARRQRSPGPEHTDQLYDLPRAKVPVRPARLLTTPPRPATHLAASDLDTHPRRSSRPRAPPPLARGRGRRAPRRPLCRPA